MRNFIQHIVLSAMVMMSLTGVAHAEYISVSTTATALVVDATKGSSLKFVYYGDRLSDGDMSTLTSLSTTGKDAYPVYGLGGASEAALSVCHADGNPTLQMDVDSYSATTDSHSKLLKVTVTLTQFDSAYLPIRRGNVWLSHLYGSWANEAQLSEEELKPGTFVIENRDGTRNSHTSHGEVMFSLDGKGRENSGRVIGAAICYSGNYKLRMVTDDSEYHQFFAGINDYNSEYHLAKGETFTTPVTAFSYSKDGLSGVSRNFHRWGREYKLMNGNRERKILLNSWEGV